MDIVSIGLAIIAGFAFGYLISQQAGKKNREDIILQGERVSNLLEENSRLLNRLGDSENEKEEYLAKFIEANNQSVANLSKVEELQKNVTVMAELRNEIAQHQTSVLDLSNQVTHLKAALESEKSNASEKIALLQSTEQKMTDQFKNIANEILEDKSKRFADQNQTSLGLLIEPLKQKISEFKSKVEEVYIQEGQQRSALGEQVRNLIELNNKLSEDAHNLTRALKGDSKTQGNWGEMILEKVLDASGLRKGHEYFIQESHNRDDNSRVQPDVVIHLPEKRHLIVDAKVSLLGYESYVNADDELEKIASLRRHKESVRNHIKGLSDKNYQKLHGIQSLDFVLMFVPIEPAFMLAISEDGDLWHDAWKKNVLLVSPSTLLFVVRTVAHLWRQEHQSRNAQDIAERGALLYDKLVGFVDDLEKVGDRLRMAKESYDSAYGKLKSGNGNLIGQADKLQQMGIKPTKIINDKLLEEARDSFQSAIEKV